MVEIVIQKVDPRVGPVRQLIEELEAYQNMLYPAESNYQLDLETMAQPQMRFYSVAVDGEFWVAAGSGSMAIMRK